MKDKRSRPEVESPAAKRRKVVLHQLAIAEFTLKNSRDVDEQDEALRIKRQLQERLHQIDDPVAAAA